MKKYNTIFFLLALSLLSPTTYGWMDMPWVLLFYLGIALYISVGSIHSIVKSGERIVLTPPDFFLICYLFCIVVLQCLHGIQSLQNEHFVSTVLFILFYFILRYSREKIDNGLFFYCTTVLTLLIIAFASKQWINSISNGTLAVEEVKFLFFNSGILALLLAVLLPVHLYHFQQDKWFFRLLAGAAIGLSIFIIIVVQSRTALLICLSSLCVYFFSHKMRGWKKNPLTVKIVVPALVVIAAIGMFFYKVDSANGRFFIWKISLEKIMDNIGGIGTGNFAYDYPLWQAEYFGQHPVMNAAAYRADMSFYAFNEWIQMLAEGGFVSFLLFSAFLFFTFRTGVEQIRTKSAKTFLLLIVGVLIASLFSYPLHNPSLFFLLLVSCAMVNKIGTVNKKVIVLPKIITKIIVLFILFVGLGSVVYLTFQYKGLQYWRKAKDNIIANESQGLEYYSKAYPLLQHKGEFLYNYGAQCFEIGMYDKSLLLLKDARQLYSHYSLFIYLGSVYQKLGQYKKAEECFRVSKTMIPSRLYPKSLIAKLYFEKGDTIQAKQIAREVIDFVPKFKSRTTDSLKNEIKNLLKYEK